MTTGRWVIALLVVAGLMAGGFWVLGYNHGTSSSAEDAAYRKHTDSLLGAISSGQQRADDSMRSISDKLLVIGGQHAATATGRDTITVTDSAGVAALRAALAQARTDSARLANFPPLVDGLTKQVTDVTASRDEWRLGFHAESLAATALLARITSDSTWAKRLSDQLAALPKPVRHGIAFAFTHPCPFGRGEYVARSGTGQPSGFEARVGLQIGGC